MNKRKLFLTAMMAAVAIPSMVASVPVFADAEQTQTKAVKDFKDVGKTHSAYTEIMSMVNDRIIFGYSDNTFKPSQSITRMHTAMLFDRALDLKPVRAGKEFKDVPKTHQYHAIVQKVYRAGIFDGNTNGTFGIADNLTRAQMAKVMVTAFDLDIHKGYIFSDVSSSHWAKDYISSLYMSGITVGNNGKYLPNDPVSRSHYAAFLFRALNPDKAPTPAKPLQPKPPVVKPEPVKPTPPVVKPTPPVVKPVPPVVKPVPPVGKPVPPVVKPVPPVVTPPTSGKLPIAEEVKTPSGWTESVMKDHDKVIADTVFKLAPKKGTGIQFGTSKYQMHRFSDPAFLSTIESTLKDHKSGMSIAEWVADVNKAILTGDVVIARDNSYGVYIKYGTFNGKPFPTIYMAL